MEHTAESSFQTELTGTEHLKFTKSAKIKWLSDQISIYDDAALLNPFYLFLGAIRYIFSLLIQPTLFLELLSYVALFVAIIAVDATLQGHHLTVPKEMEDLLAKLSTLSAFLLAFYVGLSMTRWWRLRTDGIGGIWSANNSIAPLLGIVYRSTKRASPSSAETVLSAIKRIRRYSAVSLYYFFLKSGQRGFDEDGLLRLGLLTLDELQTMRALPGTQSEYLWGAIGTECGNIADTMQQLSGHGLNPHFGAVWTEKLTELWMRGRSGAGLTAAQIGCPVLYDYAAMVPLFVRVTIIGLFAASAVQTANSHDLLMDRKHFAQSLLTVAAELWPLVFYALIFISLVITAIEAQSPFDDHRSSFPGFRYVHGLLEDFDILCNVDLKGLNRINRWRAPVPQPVPVSSQHGAGMHLAV